MGQLSPMMQKYMETKEQYKDCILFYRLGDFYEMFFDDAILASKELELTLTGKDCGLEERAPMCGIPYHAVDTYLSKLVEKGYKVAIVEQVEDPKLAKGLVKREVIRVVTPGTNLNTSSMDETKNNYLMCISYLDDKFGIAITDITTGDFMVTEVDSTRSLLDEINKFMPSEIVVNSPFYLTGIDADDLKNRLNICIFTLDSWYFDEEMCVNTLKDHFHVMNLSGLGLDDYPTGTIAAGALMKYLLETQKISLSHIIAISPYSTGKYMIIDTSTRRNLELTETLREKQKRGSLLWVLDKTKTAMGARTLRQYIEQPLVKKEDIIKRQDAIAEINDDLITREEIREYLNPVYDLERLISRISYQSANPRDLIAFRNSLELLPHIKNQMKSYKSEELSELYNKFDVLEDLYELVRDSIMEEPPITIREGGIIKDGYSEEIDKLRKAKTEGKNWIADLEAKEKERTGIKSLKIKYNKVFGYYIEVTNSFKDLVPDNYTRKQTLANAERYITDELKNLEDIILGAEEKLSAIEYDKFCLIRNTIADEVVRIKHTAKIVARIDVYASLAYVAEHNNFVRPS
ncbi:MAG: DNA mismatch repair protein MutS, partial [Lachnospiraceae bacterium]|nr:DNA mismatch repair protein MutS [Lachnospiraceae bacterium]